MKGILHDPPEFLFEWRRKTGEDRFDEVWDGVMHMVLSASVEHKLLERALIVWLSRNWMHSGREVLHQVGVSPDENWTNNYRVPDIVLLLPEARQFIRESVIQGPPTVVIEIRAPGDESFEKIPFYAGLGVPEVWIVDRDSKAVEIHELVRGEYHTVSKNELGWLTSGASEIELRTEANRLAIRLRTNESSTAQLP